MARLIDSAEALANELRARGLAAEGATPAGGADPGADRPWYIGLLLGVAGWFAGVFVLIFVFVLFKPTDAGAALVAGVVVLGAAWGLYMADREGAFVSQLALALSIAGQFAVLFGLHEIFDKHSSSIAGLALTALVLQLALVAAMPNRLHRTMSTLFACLAWAFFVRFGLWDSPGWLAQARGVPPPSFGLVLLAWAIVWLPVAAALYALIRTEPAWMAAGRQSLARPVATGLIAGLALATLATHPFDTFAWGFGIQQQRASWLALWPLLSAIAALGALLGAFALGHRGLMGICVLAALLHASHFYYTMGATLLTKSLTMMVLGAALLGAARHLKRAPAP